LIFGKKIPGLLLHHQTGKQKTTRPRIGKQFRSKGWKNMAGNR